jgi:hypothetical protein
LILGGVAIGTAGGGRAPARASVSR